MYNVRLGDIYVGFFEFEHNNSKKGFGVEIQQIDEIHDNKVWISKQSVLTDDFRYKGYRELYEVWVPLEKFGDHCEHYGFEKYENSLENTIWNIMWNIMLTPDQIPEIIYE